MARRIFLLGGIVAYAATRYEYSRNVIRSRVFSLFSLVLGGSLVILTFLFAELYQILILVETNKPIFTIIFYILGMVYFGLGIIKTLSAICEEKWFNIPPSK